MRVYMCLYVYMCLCVYVYMCVCVYVFMCLCVYMCVYVYVCVCICICLYIYGITTFISVFMFICILGDIQHLLIHACACPRLGPSCVIRYTRICVYMCMLFLRVCIIVYICLCAQLFLCTNMHACTWDICVCVCM